MMKIHGILLLLSLTIPTFAGTLTFGDMNCLNTGCYGASDPTSGATLQGLAAGTVTVATTEFGHTFPFAPDPGDFAGTDQIYVGSVQTISHDGYSNDASRLNGPDVLVLDYSSLVGVGQVVTSITIGIAADDFQFPGIGNPFTAKINGVTNNAVNNELNSVNETGPFVQFFTVGLDLSTDTPNHILTLSIDEGGDGGDGYAVDFLTVGVTTSASTATPEPSTFLMMAGALAFLLVRRFRQQ